MLRRPIGFILYSFEVPISTIELQSISFDPAIGDGDNSHPNIGRPILILADSILVSEVYVMRISTQIPVESSSRMNTGSPLVGAGVSGEN